MSRAKFVPNANFVKLEAKSGLGKNLPSPEFGSQVFWSQYYYNEFERGGNLGFS
jgi:hypothetical protein